MRSLPTRRAVAAGVAVPLLLLGAAACGGDETTPVAADAASESASVEDTDDGTATEPAAESETPEDSGTAEESDAEESGAEEESDAAGAAGGGSWDEDTIAPAMMAAMAEQETGRFAMTTTGGGADMQAEGVMSYREDRQDMAMTMSSAMFGPQSMEIRVVDGVAYLSMPPMTPQGKFLEIRPGDKGSPFAGMLDEMKVDPRDSVKAFEQGLRGLEFLGEESVDGETLEHYRLTVDFAAAAKAQGLPRTQGAPKTVDYDMWLDQDALLRRMEMELMQVALVMEMSDWGAPVTVKAPARRQIVQAPGTPGTAGS